MADHIGRYRIGQVLGVGSFATVYRAQDDLLEDEVAVKILAENHSLNPEIRERFISEGRFLRQVHSPHVVTVHDIGESDRQQPYLVLECADRGTLADRVQQLRSQGWAPQPADVLQLARALAGALTAVHGAGLVHRDLSPGNLLLASDPHYGTDPDASPGQRPLLGSDERLLVADLGMCKDLALNSGLTVAGGTSGFRPPEQHGGVVDTRADLWAISQLLRWLSSDAHLPEGLQRVLERGLAADPAHRHGTIDEWLSDIEAALAPEPSAPVAAAERPESAALTDPVRRRIVGAAVLMAVLVLGVIAGMAGYRWAMSPPAHTAGAEVTISGPDQVQQGQPATFTADVQGADTWVWVLPDGRYIVGDRTVELEPTSTGTARVQLWTHDDEQDPLRAVHDLEVVE